MKQEFDFYRQTVDLEYKAYVMRVIDRRQTKQDEFFDGIAGKIFFSSLALGMCSLIAACVIFSIETPAWVESLCELAFVSSFTVFGMSALAAYAYIGD